MLQVNDIKKAIKADKDGIAEIFCDTAWIIFTIEEDRLAYQYDHIDGSNSGKGYLDKDADFFTLLENLNVTLPTIHVTFNIGGKIIDHAIQYLNFEYYNKNVGKLCKVSKLYTALNGDHLHLEQRGDNNYCIYHIAGKQPYRGGYVAVR